MSFSPNRKRSKHLLALEQVERAITVHELFQPPIRRETRHAAVSVVLRRQEDQTEALFILRATTDTDPWSGHMAFPGGHYESIDETLRHTAERETLEEIGLDLATSGRYIGAIESVQANPRGRDLDMVVWPFVYELTDPSAEMTPNYEVADIMWGSLDAMHTGDSHTHAEFTVGGERVEFPGYQVDDEVVWGLTYRMVDKFFALLDEDWVER
ncbi:MAG: 8-oxo-dGTP pyrophosphatase MutT (NUDIX family) [Candidatus Azotimanducaceae bacterium]